MAYPVAGQASFAFAVEVAVLPLPGFVAASEWVWFVVDQAFYLPPFLVEIVAQA